MVNRQLARRVINLMPDQHGEPRIFSTDQINVGEKYLYRRQRDEKCISEQGFVADGYVCLCVLRSPDIIILIKTAAHDLTRPDLTEKHVGVQTMIGEMFANLNISV